MPTFVSFLQLCQRLLQLKKAGTTSELEATTLKRKVNNVKTTEIWGEKNRVSHPQYMLAVTKLLPINSTSVPLTVRISSQPARLDCLLE